MEFYFKSICFLTCFITSESARILAVFPSPSISHQVAFRPFTQELVKRGHEVVVITTDPAFPKGETPKNLTEIDIHDVSYKTWMMKSLEQFKQYSQAGGTVLTGKKNFMTSIKMLFLNFVDVFEVQIMNSEIQELLKSNKTFDILILEACNRPFLILSHFFKAPVIIYSSFGNSPGDYDILGTPMYPLLYSTTFRTKIYNLSYLDKLSELYLYYSFKWFQREYEEKQNEVFKKLFGPTTPTINELYNNVGMMFLNMHPIWEGNLPVPPSVVHVGGIHVYENSPKPLPKDLQTTLDDSKNGVIYVSFGTNVSPSAMSRDKFKIMLNVLSKLAYDVLWKWDKDELPGKTNNIKIAKWFPQADLLRHPNIRVFITQGGLQSTDEAILAGVPLLGIPMIGDQWFNTEKYVHHKIGKQIDLDELTEDKFKSAIIALIEDKSYRANVLRLKRLMQDQPQRPLERAVWWTEHVLRHGTDHLRAPTANLTWIEYNDVGFITSLLLSIIIMMILVLYLFKYLISVLSKLLSKEYTKTTKNKND